MKKFLHTFFFLFFFCNMQALTWVYGSYTGNGTNGHSITGLGFRPDVLIVKSSTASPAFIKTGTQAANESKQMNVTGGFSTNAITSFTSNGFTVGTNASVNTNGTTYYFVAFDAGTDLVESTFTGNGGISQSISGLGFRPELVIVFSNSSLQSPGFLNSSMPDDKTSRFGSTGMWGFYIKTLDANGFTVNSNYNENSKTYYYAAFNSPSNSVLVNGSYTGSASNKSVNISASMTNPGFVLVCNSDVSSLPVAKIANMPSSASVNFDASATTSNDITAFGAGTFTVKAGSTDANSTSYPNYFSAFGSGGVLPVELQDFKVNCKNGKAEISWITASEVNNDYFTVERSTDGETFQSIGTVNGAGNSKQSRLYSLTDDEPLSGSVYYRLKQTDYDGKQKYFNLVSFDNCRLISGLDVNLYPNPLTDEVNYQFELEHDGQLQIEIMDVLGKIVYSKQLQATKGNQLLKLDLSDLPKGLYIFRMNDGVNHRSKKITKQ
ncbi:MAG TPA: T9SS type A sorting domain-containing protein [Bacteroidia bacterium]|nr:T9SS type A sorting domain-containing protein [Bacteroidia bacterium]